MSLVGKVGVFKPSGKGKWEEEYGNTQCTIVEEEGEPSDITYGLKVEFEDGKRIVIGVDEFKEALN